MTMRNERVTVLMEIEEQLDVLRRTEFVRLIPEVGSNIAYAIEGASDSNDVAAIPGRIRDAMGKPAFMKPMFGASSHVASIIIGAMKHDPEKRCALNIRYSEALISACRKLGLTTVFVDRMEEPDRVRDEEGSSVPWVLKKAMDDCGCVPDVIYHKGAVGKEAITMILGKDPAHVAGIALEVLKRVL